MIWQKNKRLDVIYSVSLHPNSLNSMMTSYLEEVAEIITHLSFYAGWPKAWSAFNIAKDILKKNRK